jgi:glycosyltransferase involved in cell wall biosynthesis
VTLHDAWWLSRYIFLIDEFGETVDPSNPLSGGSPKSNEETKALLHRDRVLRGVLSRAKLILAVSQKFADLYIQAGVEGVLVHENIVEPFEVFERKPEADGKIVLGFIGGMSKHKGYHLFRQALEEGDFSNFKALIVDTSLNDGESYETVWGSTAVKFIPKVKQAEIGKLYAQMDVLVAPSIWPESFGLVTREAVKAGVWVVTSDKGAIGDSLESGRNGTVIQIENDKILCTIFKSLYMDTSWITRGKNEAESIDIACCKNLNNYLTDLLVFYKSASKKSEKKKS